MCGDLDLSTFLAGAERGIRVPMMGGDQWLHKPCLHPPKRGGATGLYHPCHVGIPNLGRSGMAPRPLLYLVSKVESSDVAT